jgi:uncharacterized membrane protein
MARSDKQDIRSGRGSRRGNGESGAYSSIATHPRARASVRKAKAWTALIAFVITAALSLNASVPVFQVGVRALIAGLVGYLLAWWFSMMVWRQLIMAELKVAVEEITRRRDTDAAERQQAEARTGG